MRADRLLSLLLILRRKPLTTAGELAEQLEVSERTVHRDIEALSTAGVPVYSERGRHGGFALLDGWTTDVSGLTAPEAQAVLAAGSRSAANALGLGPAFASGLNKLLSTMPEPQRQRTLAATSRILVTTEGFVPPRESVPFLGVLQHAVVDGKRLRLRYQARTSDAPATRTVDPVGLVHARAVWYLLADHRGRPRTYRVSRIDAAAPLDAPARRTADADLEQRWADAQASFRSTFTAISAVVDVRAEALWQVVHERSELLDGARSGWRRLRIPFGDRRQAVGVLWSLGPDASVLSPPWLRDELTARAEAMIADRPAGDMS